MKTRYQEFFELCCQRRLQEYTMRIDLEKTPQAVALAHYLLGYLDQCCLDLASKHLLEASDLQYVDQHSHFDMLQNVPKFPIWMSLSSPQQLYGIASDDTRVTEYVVAAYFYALESPEVLRHALVPPFVERPWTKNDPLTPTWWEYQLDLIDSTGAIFNDYHFSYDQRTAQWRKKEASMCRWGQCRYTMDEDFEDSQVLVCQQCQEAMNYYSSWITIILNEQLGQPLELKNIEFENRKRRIFKYYL